MRFERASFNQGRNYFETQKPGIKDEIEKTIEAIPYQVQFSNEDGKDNHLIFDPTGTNQAIQDRLERAGWDTTVRFRNPEYSSRRHIDIVKQEITGEIQFSNYPYLDRDMNRLRELYTGDLELETGNEVEAGVYITVKEEMPTSQSVANFHKATNVVAPRALFQNAVCPDCGAESKIGIPTLVYGIEAPKVDETVILNRASDRSRDEPDKEEILFREVYYDEESDQQELPT